MRVLYCLLVYYSGNTAPKMTEVVCMIPGRNILMAAIPPTKLILDMIRVVRWQLRPL